MQQFTSAATSCRQVPAIIKAGDRLELWHRGQKVLDYGGGKYDDGVEALAERGVECRVWDPFNRAATHNDAAMLWAQRQGVDAVILSNVVNVIDCNATVLAVLDDALAVGPVVYVTVYEGDRSGKGRETSRGWQRNARLAEYVEWWKAAGFNVTRLPGNVLAVAR